MDLSAILGSLTSLFEFFTNLGGILNTFIDLFGGLLS